MDLNEIFGEELANKIKENLKDGLFFGNEKDYVSKSRFNEVNEQNKSYKSIIEETNKQLESFKSNESNSEELKKQLEELQKKNEENATNHEKQMQEIKFNNALELALKDNKAKNAKAVKALLNMENLKLNEEGKIEGLEESLNKIKENDSYLFGEDIIKGIQPKTNNEPSKLEITKDLIDEMDKAKNTDFFIKYNEEVKEFMKNN